MPSAMQRAPSRTPAEARCASVPAERSFNARLSRLAARCLALLAMTLLVLPLLTDPAAAQGATAGDQQSQSYTLGAGDRIKVTVFGHPDLSGEFEVDGTGLIAMPLIKEVEATDLTARQLEARIADHLEPDYLRNPRVSVEVLSYRPFYIIGEIKEPGSYPYVSGMTAWNAVALAGGFTYRAKTGYVLLRRGGRDDAQQVPLDSQVQPGDVIEVAERFF